MGLRAESKLPNDEGNEFSESMALLSKIFERALKRLNTQANGKLSASLIFFRGRLIGRSWVRLKEIQGQTLGTSQSNAKNLVKMVTSK